MYTVINGRVAIECTKETEGAFEYFGTWYIYERDFDRLKMGGK